MDKTSETTPIAVHDSRVHERVQKNQACTHCYRLKSECICQKVISFPNKIQLIILQHPQEQYKVLNSAHLAHLALKNSTLRVGLSWPSFKSVAGPNENPSEWGILYLSPKKISKPCQIINRHKKLVEDFSFLRGIVALDGSWKQAKALWWRNPWFLKLNRISLNPDHPSLRNQTKKEGMSTIESIAMAFTCLGEAPEVSLSLLSQYEELIVGNIR